MCGDLCCGADVLYDPIVPVDLLCCVVFCCVVCYVVLCCVLL